MRDTVVTQDISVRGYRLTLFINFENRRGEKDRREQEMRETFRVLDPTATDCKTEMPMVFMSL